MSSAASGTTEVVPFPVVALPNPKRDGPWNPTLRKVREEWGTRGSWWCRLTAGSSPGFQPRSE